MEPQLFSYPQKHQGITRAETGPFGRCVFSLMATGVFMLATFHMLYPGQLQPSDTNELLTCYNLVSCSLAILINF